MTRDDAFGRLAKSKFRSRFHLSAADRRYVADKGLELFIRFPEDFDAAVEAYEAQSGAPAPNVELYFK